MLLEIDRLDVAAVGTDLLMVDSHADYLFRREYHIVVLGAGMPSFFSAAGCVTLTELWRWRGKELPDSTVRTECMDREL